MDNMFVSVAVTVALFAVFGKWENHKKKGHANSNQQDFDSPMWRLFKSA